MTILALIVVCSFVVAVVGSMLAVLTMDSGPDWLNGGAVLAAYGGAIVCGVSVVLLVLGALGLRLVLT